MPTGTDNPEICNFIPEGKKLINKINERVIGRIALLLLVVSILLSSLSSCFLFEHEVKSKEEIYNNLLTAEKNDSYDYVSDYLSDFGVPNFNTFKFVSIEEKVKNVYCYGSGLPDTLSHAKETTKLFLDNYYDEIDISNKTAVTDALLTCYAVATGDPYTIYRPPVEAEEFFDDMSGEFGGIGVLVEYIHEDESIIVNTVYPGSPAEKAGVKSGDYIYAIDDKTVEELGYLNAVYHVRGKIGTTVELTLIRGGEFVTLSMVRAKVEEINVDYEIEKESGIAYVQIVQFKGNTYDQFVEAIDAIEAAGAKGIVFDLRGNPGGYLNSVTSVISYLIPNGHTVVSYKENNKDPYFYTSTDDNKDGDHVVDLPFVVICNELTASAGEIFTAALRDYDEQKILRATIVGTTTYKKGIMQNTYTYFDGSSITTTIAYYDPPCGINYHGIGVTPDVIVENTDSEIDLQLDVAYAEMQKLINTN